MGAAGVASAGLIALAVSMGIGRFAFTPILPMMQADAGLTIKAAGWLASANYLGYLIGALCAARVPRTWAIRGGLLLIVLVTAAMGLADAFAVWIVLRLLAGVASAWVMIHVSAWGLERLTALRHTRKNGLIFAGIGVGIAGAGLICLALMAANVGSARTWEVLGAVSLLFTLATWSAFRSGTDEADHARMPLRAGRLRWNAERIRVALCYGAFGFGYIIPATYLPAMARHYVANPLAFGWAWPVFGVAAAVFASIVSRWLNSTNNRRVWATASLLMAIGVVLPVAWRGLGAILVAALLVGGPLLILTTTALREAREVAADQATAFIAAITAVFAVGQIVGPLIVSALAHLAYGLDATLLAGAMALTLAAVSLWRSTRLSVRTKT